MIYALFLRGDLQSILLATFFDRKVGQTLVQDWLWNGPDIQRRVFRTGEREEISYWLLGCPFMYRISDFAPHVAPQVISVGNVPTVEDAFLPFVGGVFIG